MSPLLEVRDLTTTFETPSGPARAVDGVSFDLERGEVLALVGESGCGKTTLALSLLRLIAEPPGRIDPRSTIGYDGVDLLRLRPQDLRPYRGGEIAMIFQEPAASLNPVLSIGTQIVETVRAHIQISRRAARARASELLAAVGIGDPQRRLDQYPHELSGGMQQRVMIAIALAGDPKVLIADEPTTALDVTIQAQILELLAELRQRLGLAVLLITHDLGIAAGIADRVAVMYAGRLVEQAPTAVLFRQPVHPYAEALLKAVPRLDRPTDRLYVIPAAMPPATGWPHGCRFHPRCPSAWDQCRAEEPGMLSVDGGRNARCWLVREPERRRSGIA